MHPFYFIFVPNMRIVKLTSLIILSVLMGGLFLYSAYTKVIPIQTFEYTLVEFVHMPWWLAAVIARLFVGLETAIAACLILNMYGKAKWILRFSLFILIMFSIYLAYLWITVGNDVNCGCFGDQIWMSPSTSLIKNLIIFVLTFILLKFHTGIAKKWSNWTTIALFVIITSLPYFIYAIPATQPSYLKDEAYEIDLSALYEQPEKTPAPTIDLKKGKHILAFMSLTCPHCKIAAYKMQLMKKDNPSISMYMVLNGDSTNLKPFFEKTKADNIEYRMLLGRDFTSLSGFSLPAIYWINNSVVEAKSTYIDLSQTQIEAWLKKD